MAKLSARGNGAELFRVQREQVLEGGRRYIETRALFESGKVLQKAQWCGGEAWRNHATGWTIMAKVHFSETYTPQKWLDFYLAKGWSRVK